MLVSLLLRRIPECAWFGRVVQRRCRESIHRGAHPGWLLCIRLHRRLAEHSA